MFFADAGELGLPVTHGSNRTRLPAGDWIRNVAWPSHVNESAFAMARYCSVRTYSKSTGF